MSKEGQKPRPYAEEGAKLRRARDAKGLSLKAVEAATDVPSSVISRVENGQQEPKATQLEALRRLYGMDASRNGETAFDEGVRWGMVVTVRNQLTDAVARLNDAIPASALRPRTPTVTGADHAADSAPALKTVRRKASARPRQRGKA